MRRGQACKRLASLGALCCLLATAGCVTSSPFGLAGPDGSHGSKVPVEPAPPPRPEPSVAATAATIGPTVAPPPAPQPDAVIKVNPGSVVLTDEMEARLATIARQANADARLMLRLESYVPDGGSPSLNLGRAEQTLQVVRKRLMDLKVSPRRIVLAPFGGEFTTARDARRHWVEIYLIRPRL
ncbi:MAG: hypothetical protein R3E35_09090 [Rhodocyclaceae bacterium]